jgi:hypothetical protein
MSKVRIQLLSSGVKALLKSPEIESVLEEHARATAAACGDGYTTDVYIGKTRANAMVQTYTEESYFDNISHDTILNNLR